MKDGHNIQDFGILMAMNTGLVADLAGTDPLKFDEALAMLINTYLDDGHSGFVSGSVLSGEDTDRDENLSELNLGPSRKAKSDLEMKFYLEREKAYSQEVPGYEEVGDTAFITFDEFEIIYNGFEDYYDSQTVWEDPQDTIELIIYANRQIKREGSPVKNIVVDLSNNEGGVAPAAVALISWFLGDAPIALRDMLTSAQTNMVYNADLNLDKTYTEEGDTVSSGYRLYCLTSPVSFSCGSLVPAAFKNSGKVILVGQRTGGGSCVVLPCTTASGAVFMISGPKQISIIKNGGFYNTDEGIEPDVLLTLPESFYDRPALAEYLKSLK